MIYFIHDVTSGMVKIGKAIDPETRLAMLQIGNPNELYLGGVIPGGRSEEAELHRRFAAYRSRGEWFRTEPALLQAIDKLLSVGSLHRNVWEECRRRSNCRAGLPGVSLMHVPSGVRFGCRSTAWGRDGELLIYTEQPGSSWPAPAMGPVRASVVAERARLLPPPLVFQASECVLESEWPVVCCPPIVGHVST